MEKLDYTKTLRKIPILIYRCPSSDLRGWRCEIADDNENYKPRTAGEINFEDLSFHFRHPTPNLEAKYPDLVELGFRTKSDAVEAAQYCNERYLNGNAKLWRV